MHPAVPRLIRHRNREAVVDDLQLIESEPLQADPKRLIGTREMGRGSPRARRRASAGATL